MRDLHRSLERPEAEGYIDYEKIDSIQIEINEVEVQINANSRKTSNIENQITVANNNYQNAKRSFDNWLETRKTVGSSAQDKEVLSRADRLDSIYENEQQLRDKMVQVASEMEDLQSQQYDLFEQEREVEYQAEVKRMKAHKKYELNVFLIRLLVVFPILGIGIFFLFKFRNHKYWPLFLGFVFFSFYAFFVGLLPYLPWYGGYIRYTVGIILSIAFGIYFINLIKKFIERKKLELTASQKERSKTVKTDTAEKALDNHMCPSCGKDFILTKWDKAVTGKVATMKPVGLATNYCRFCGLELFKKCKSCDTENFAHLPYCSTCGDDVIEK